MPKRRIRINAGPVTMEAMLNESTSAERLWEALPIDGRANRWGDEIYFPIPVEMGAENGRETVALGEIAYWPPGTAFCIFFGRTPASRGDEIRAASAVNPLGTLDGDATAFRAVPSGTPIVIERATP